MNTTDYETRILAALAEDSINSYVTHLQENTGIPYRDLWDVLDSMVDKGVVSLGDNGGPTRIYL